MRGEDEGDGAYTAAQVLGCFDPVVVVPSAFGEDAPLSAVDDSAPAEGFTARS